MKDIPLSSLLGKRADDWLTRNQWRIAAWFTLACFLAWLILAVYIASNIQPQIEL